MILNKNNDLLYGLVLIGGKSERMKEDKATLYFHKKEQWKYCYDMMSDYCDNVYVSTSMFSIKVQDSLCIDDCFHPSFGPLTGILSAMKKYNNVAWLVLACDMPFFNKEALKMLVNSRDKDADVTSFVNTKRNALEPLSAIYESRSFIKLLEFWSNNIICPKEIIHKLNVKKIIPKELSWLSNVNFPDEMKKAKLSLNKNNIGCYYNIKYFAAMRETRGLGKERIYIQMHNVSDLYNHLKHKYNFSYDKSNLRVLINNIFVSWDYKLKDKDDVIFLPPVSGG